MAALFDTTVGVLLLRRSLPAEAGELTRAARTEIEAGTALLPAVAVSELLVGESSEAGTETLLAGLGALPTVVLPPGAAREAGVMGGFLRAAGAPVPLPDLLIAATALWLEIPLLTWDGDYARARGVAVDSCLEHTGRELWLELRLHPASRGA